MLNALGPPPLTRSVKRQSVHHLPRFSKFTWAVIICFAVFATALWFAGGRCEVRIHHAGYTNTPNTETRYAAYGVFVITNVGSGNVTLWPEFLLEGEGKTIAAHVCCGRDLDRCAYVSGRFRPTRAICSRLDLAMATACLKHERLELRNAYRPGFIWAVLDEEATCTQV